MSTTRANPGAASLSPCAVPVSVRKTPPACMLERPNHDSTSVYVQFSQLQRLLMKASGAPVRRRAISITIVRSPESNARLTSRSATCSSLKYWAASSIAIVRDITGPSVDPPAIAPLRFGSSACTRRRLAI